MLSDLLIRLDTSYIAHMTLCVARGRLIRRDDSDCLPLKCSHAGEFIDLVDNWKEMATHSSVLAWRIPGMGAVG